MNNYEFEPIKKWHSNGVLRGQGDVKALPVTFSQGNIYSIWKVNSFWQRIKFLLSGEVTLIVASKMHPPVGLVCGDIGFTEK